jgi:D-serine deaminase-like pyridoxal phosphate-dependent protein
VRVPDYLETPAVVVDPERLERNLTRMADAAAAAGVALRPHAKTHKCLEIGRLQLSHGAIGLTVATLAEAEAFAAAGCPSVFVAFRCGPLPATAPNGSRPYGRAPTCGSVSTAPRRRARWPRRRPGAGC